MKILIKRHIESGVRIEREKCVELLSEVGLVIKDAESICFKEKAHLTTNMTVNWRILFNISL